MLSIQIDGSVCTFQADGLGSRMKTQSWFQIGSRIAKGRVKAVKHKKALMMKAAVASGSKGAAAAAAAAAWNKTQTKYKYCNHISTIFFRLRCMS